jgi:benzylsuccinate CoA-transferase BbsF subunit
MSEVRVLSFGGALAGNSCAMTLAELGADVIKIESPARYDMMRTPFFPDHPRVTEPSGAETSAVFGGVARSVRSLALSMGSEKGCDIFRSLVPLADVVLENFRPGMLDRWGVGFDALQRLNPRIILVSMSGFGATGPRRNYACYAGISAAFTGMTRRVGVSDGFHHDYVAAVHAALATLAALAYRDRTGMGIWIDQAQTESGAALMGVSYLDAMLNERPAEGSTGATAAPAVHGIFPCVEPDAWLAIEVRGADDWTRLKALIHSDGIALEPDLAPGLVAERAKELIGRWTAQQRSQSALRRLMRAGVPAGAVQRGEDLYRDPQLRERHAIREVIHPDLGAIEYPAPAHRLSGTPAMIRAPAPRLGEHTSEILTAMLGLSEDELHGLRQEDVIR